MKIKLKMIANYFMKHFFLKFIIFSFALPIMPNVENKDWDILQNNSVWIAYTQIDFPLCKATLELDYSVSEILNLIEDVDNYYKIFDSVVKSKLSVDDIVHIAIDLPIPFSDRDYIVKFNKYQDKLDTVYSFKTNQKLSQESLNDDYVRLINAKGEWRLTPLKNNKTLVSYMWNGSMEGNFPNWALKNVWKKQGNEVLINLKEALDNKEEN